MTQNSDYLLLLSDVAGGFATMAAGADKTQLERSALTYLRSAMDAKYGPVPDDIATLTDDEILQHLIGF